MKRVSMSPEKLADKIIAGIEKDRAVVTCPLYIKVFHAISKFFPRLWDRLNKTSARVGYKAREANR
jgi:short-subunit dehydrogenase